MFFHVQKAPLDLLSGFHQSVGCRRCGWAPEGWRDPAGVARGVLMVSEELQEQISAGYVPALACYQLHVLSHGLQAAPAARHSPC